MVQRWMMVMALGGLLALGGATACGSDDPSPADPDGMDDTGDGDGDGDGDDGADPTDDGPSDECQGFEVLGLEYSPGGDVLPDTCKPFDTLTNNPYAIRCIDADPSYSSGYPGDEFCILPPHPDKGTQVRVGPDSYDDIEDKHFIMQPGEEFNDYYYVNAPNEEEHYFYRVNMRMRAGSHHMINRMYDDNMEDGWSNQGDGVFGGEGSRGFPGAQRPDQDRPNGKLEVPPENQGLGDVIGPKQQFSFNLHHFNLTDGETLREVWVNVWYKPKDEVTDQLGSIFLLGNPTDLAIDPGERRELHYKCDVPGDTRIVSLFGHRHAWTDRFGAWIVRDNGDVENVYESFNYDDMPTYSFDTITDNPSPDKDLNQDGGHTGVLDVSKGDELHFVCDITNGGEQRLRFANEVLTGEMCILFGNYIGDPLCRGVLQRVQE